MNGRIRQRAVVFLLRQRSSTTSNCSKRAVHGRRHRRQVGHERHVGRVEQFQLRLVVEEAGHAVDQGLAKQRRLGRAAVRRKQSHDAARLNEYVQNRFHLLQNRLGTNLHGRQ